MYSQHALLLLSAVKLIPPGSIGFLVLFAVIGLGVMAFVPSGRRVTRLALGLLLASYVLLSIPRVADTLSARWPASSESDIASGTQFDAILVLDGDNRRGRVRTARQLAGAPAAPPVVVLADTGDPWVVNSLVSSGVPIGGITSETGAETTREQVERARRVITSHPWNHVALVASRLQSPRLSALVRGWPVKPTIVAAPVDDEPPHGGLRAFVPSYIALRVSRDALYEHVALIYYRWRGWI